MRGPVLVATLVALALAPGARASVPDVTPLRGWDRAAGVRVAAAIELGPGDAHRVVLGSTRWALSLTLHAPDGATLRISSRKGAPVRLHVRDGHLTSAVGLRPRDAVRVPRQVTQQPGTNRVELVGGPAGARLTVNGVLNEDMPRAGSPLTLRNTGTRPLLLEALTLTTLARRDALLLHRIAHLRSHTAPGRFPLGESGELHFSGGWTSGFWPSALWQASRLVPDGPYDDWALAASTARIGREQTPIHDVGFMFGRSVAAAHERLCARRTATARCRVLRRSGLAAAQTLAALARTSVTGMIPTDAEGAEAETIVDSLMNVGLLTWASRVGGDRSFAELARRHARLVSSLLLRPDGSTIQVAVHDRAGGRLLRLGTRQGLSDDSTWARGQAWAIHGLASTGADLGDRALVGAAERAAGYWESAAPRKGLPPYDFAAGPSAPRDSSAAAIAAAGMYELARACAELGGACARGRAHWRDAAGSALASALTAVSVKSPLGRLGEQAGTVGPRGGAWDDRAELIWGLDFLLEAVAARGWRT